MKTLQEFSKDAEQAYARLRKDSLGAVRHWVYGRGALFFFDPTPFEALGLSPGLEVKSEEKVGAKYGYDAQGRVVYERSGVKGCFHESFSVRRSVRELLS